MLEYLADRANWQTFGPFIVPAFLIFFSAWAGIVLLIIRRKNAKREEFPHTMSESEYTKLNEKRFSG